MTAAEDIYTPEHLSRREAEIRYLAQAAHEMNRAYCAAMGDTSQLPWDQAPDWQKDSCISGVRGVLKGNTPKESHEGWLAHKRADGWVYGPVKDPAKREHPCMVPYEELPVAQKLKDMLFVNTINTLYVVLGKALYHKTYSERIAQARAALAQVETDAI